MTTTQTPEKKAINANDGIALLLLCCYLLVDFIPLSIRYTPTIPQWLYVNVLNVLVAGYIIYDKSSTENPNFKALSQSKLVWVYGLFLLLTGVSIGFSSYAMEGWVTWAHYLVAFISCANLYLLFKDKMHLFLGQLLFLGSNKIEKKES